MTRAKAVLLACAAALSAAVASPAWAHGRGHHHHGGRIHFGIMLGAPLVYHHWPRYHYPARTVVIREEPQVYIEKGDGAGDAPPSASPSSTGWWYYCRGADMYYPYTKHCPGGWERVAPQPAP